MTNRSHVIHLAETQAAIPVGERSVCALQRGALDINLGRPARPNKQMPHDQDELYVVIRGRGFLFHDGERDRFEPGDLLFVAAKTEHHFEGISDELLVWRVFYGPRGGDASAASVTGVT